MEIMDRLKRNILDTLMCVDSVTKSLIIEDLEEARKELNTLIQQKEIEWITLLEEQKADCRKLTDELAMYKQEAKKIPDWCKYRRRCGCGNDCPKICRKYTDTEGDK